MELAVASVNLLRIESFLPIPAILSKMNQQLRVLSAVFSA